VVDGYHPELGFGVLPGLLTESEAAAIAAACWQVLASSPDHVRDKDHSGTRWLADVANRVPAVADLLREPRLVEAVEAVVGPHPGQGQTSFRCPMPGFGAQRLHADGVAKLDAGPDRIAVAIVALCAFTPENGSTRVIPGSHRRPDLQRHSGKLRRHDAEQVLTGPAGTAFVFSGHVLHSGQENTSMTPRPALQLTWSRSA
jgi:ectoine hydroxylase-related dioxygenase (phytanoyl-CoA dioxygenase family)